jgi:hypothetical protein
MRLSSLHAGSARSRMKMRSLHEPWSGQSQWHPRKHLVHRNMRACGSPRMWSHTAAQAQACCVANCAASCHCHVEVSSPPGGPQPEVRELRTACAGPSAQRPHIFLVASLVPLQLCAVSHPLPQLGALAVLRCFALPKRPCSVALFRALCRS